jgi:hypothetical protein
MKVVIHAPGGYEQLKLEAVAAQTPRAAWGAR